MTKAIKWTGDFANAPKSGVVVFANGMAFITWSDGSEMTVPEFTINARYGWTVEK